MAQPLLLVQGMIKSHTVRLAFLLALLLVPMTSSARLYEVDSNDDLADDEDFQFCQLFDDAPVWHTICDSTFKDYTSERLRDWLTPTDDAAFSTSMIEMQDQYKQANAYVEIGNLKRPAGGISSNWSDDEQDARLPYIQTLLGMQASYASHIVNDALFTQHKAISRKACIASDGTALSNILLSTSNLPDYNQEFEFVHREERDSWGINHHWHFLQRLNASWAYDDICVDHFESDIDYADNDQIDHFAPECQKNTGCQYVAFDKANKKTGTVFTILGVPLFKGGRWHDVIRYQYGDNGTRLYREKVKSNSPTITRSTPLPKESETNYSQDVADTTIIDHHVGSVAKWRIFKKIIIDSDMTIDKPITAVLPSYRKLNRQVFLTIEGKKGTLPTLRPTTDFKIDPDKTHNGLIDIQQFDGVTLSNLHFDSFPIPIVSNMDHVRIVGSTFTHGDNPAIKALSDVKIMKSRFISERGRLSIEIATWYGKPVEIGNTIFEGNGPYIKSIADPGFGPAIYMNEYRYLNKSGDTERKFNNAMIHSNRSEFMYVQSITLSTECAPLSSDKCYHIALKGENLETIKRIEFLPISGPDANEQTTQSDDGSFTTLLGTACSDEAAKSSPSCRGALMLKDATTITVVAPYIKALASGEWIAIGQEKGWNHYGNVVVVTHPFSTKDVIIQDDPITFDNESTPENEGVYEEASKKWSTQLKEWKNTCIGYLHDDPLKDSDSIYQGLSDADKEQVDSCARLNACLDYDSFEDAGTFYDTTGSADPVAISDMCSEIIIGASENPLTSVKHGGTLGQEKVDDPTPPETPPPAKEEPVVDESDPTKGSADTTKEGNSDTGAKVPANPLESSPVESGTVVKQQPIEAEGNAQEETCDSSGTYMYSNGNPCANQAGISCQLDRSGTGGSQAPVWLALILITLLTRIRFQIRHYHWGPETPCGGQMGL